MAMNRCPRPDCDRTQFEVAPLEPKTGSGDVTLKAVRCTSCGSVVGVIDAGTAFLVKSLADAR